MPDNFNYFDEKIKDVSITSTNPVDNPVDSGAPLTFNEWLQYNSSLYTNAEEFLSRYQSYLNNWYQKKNLSVEEQTISSRDLYTQLISEIVINYSSSEEKRFLKNIDINNNRDLAIAIPFFSTKIKEICLYYSTLRDEVNSANIKFNLRGSDLGLEKLIYNEVSKSLENEDLVDLISTLGLSLSEVRNNLVVEVGDLYDTYSNYLDVSPDKQPSDYNLTPEDDRSKYFSLNQYDINSDVFINLNSAIVTAITGYPFYLIELGTNNFSITPNVSPQDLIYLKDSDFINTINTNNKDNLNLNLDKLLTPKFMGTSYYFLSTGTTQTNYVTGLLFDAKNKFANYLNKRYPTVAAVASDSFLKTGKEIGLFFKPDKLGLTTFVSKDFNAQVNAAALSANTLYVFPDPSEYGNVSGLTKENFSSPLIFNENNYDLKIDFSNQYRFGEADSNPYYQTFRGYQSREQSLQDAPQGISRYVDSQEFFAGDLKKVWANKDTFPLFPITRYPLDERIDALVSINKTLVNYKSDIFGNEYSVYKNSHPSRLIDDLVKYLLNRVKERIYYCLLVNGHFYYDSVSGFNFNYAVQDVAKGYSGIILKTTTNIPPGSGYWLQGGTFATSTSAYNQGPPQFYLSGAPTPLASYRFLPEKFCPSYIEKDFECFIADGVTFTGKNGEIFDDYSSDRSSFNEDSNVYYNTLYDAGMNPAGPRGRANTVNPGIFNYNPPQSAYSTLDNYLYLYRGIPICSTVFQLPSYTENNNFLNYKLPNRDTKALTEAFSMKKRRSVYELKYVDLGEIYFRSSNSDTIAPASAALSSVFIKYDTFIQNEIYNNSVGLDVYYDVLQIDTVNYTIFDKLKFNYETNQIIGSTRSDVYFKAGDSNLEKISTVWFNEVENALIICKTVLFPELSATNSKILYPEIYSIDLRTLNFTQLYPFAKRDNLTMNDVASFTLSSLNVNIVSIDKPLLSYSSETETYSITYLGRDMSGVMYIFKTYFRYINGKIANIYSGVYDLRTNASSINIGDELTGYSTDNILGTGNINYADDALIMG